MALGRTGDGAVERVSRLGPVERARARMEALAMTAPERSMPVDHEQRLEQPLGWVRTWRRSEVDHGLERVAAHSPHTCARRAPASRVNVRVLR
jgi:hypothetical protein